MSKLSHKTNNCFKELMSREIHLKSHIEGKLGITDKPNKASSFTNINTDTQGSCLLKMGRSILVISVTAITVYFNRSTFHTKLNRQAEQIAMLDAPIKSYPLLPNSHRKS